MNASTYAEFPIAFFYLYLRDIPIRAIPETIAQCPKG
jgi:hypothetical protein